MTLTVSEQLFLELVNRARLDPLAEAARQGVDLNAGLAAGQIGGGAKQVLAPDALLDLAATRHAQWMLAVDAFSHVGDGGATVEDRVRASGFALGGTWLVGENLAWSGSTGGISADAMATQHMRQLFLSAGHRANMLNGSFRETGIAQEIGVFTAGGTDFNASMLTQKFALSNGRQFITGVVIDDRDGDRFYDIGEGIGGAGIATAGGSTTTGAAGGYALAVASGAAVGVTLTLDGIARQVSVDTRPGNVKLDLMADGTILTSGHLTLGTGATDAAVLGVAGLALTGNGAANRLTGGQGADTLDGGAGADTLTGGAGDDTYHVDHAGDRVVETALGGTDHVLAALSWALGDAVEHLTLTGTARTGTGNGLDNRLTGHDGDNRLSGGDGRDTLDGGGGNDTLIGGAGNDSLLGGDGRDRLAGGDGADTLAGGAGNDTYDADALDTLVELAGGGTDTVLVRGGAGWTLAEYFEHLTLKGSALAGTGNAAANRIAGSGADNTLAGLAGDDTLSGRAGDDTLDGGAGTDRLSGGAGNDRLSGGTGNDRLTGGGGADVFVLASGGGRDRITDFSLAQGDRLALDAALWGGAGSIEAMLAAQGRSTDAGVVLDFGADRLTIAGLDDPGLLAGLIDLL